MNIGSYVLVGYCNEFVRVVDFGYDFLEFFFVYCVEGFCQVLVMKVVQRLWGWFMYFFLICVGIIQIFRKEDLFQVVQQVVQQYMGNDQEGDFVVGSCYRIGDFCICRYGWLLYF